MPITLAQLNAAPLEEAAQMLTGLYEHSDWIAAKALQARPFLTLAQLKYAMTQVLHQATRAEQLALIRAHPELAGKAMISNSLTAESRHEQSRAGLTECTPQEFAQLQQLNAAYKAKFGFPFILAVRGPRGLGLNKQHIIAAFERRLQHPPEFELQECLRHIHRIVEIRLQDKFGTVPVLGQQVWDWQEMLAQYSEAAYAELGQLTVTYLSDAHRACAERIRRWMRDCGFDTVDIDAVGNVVGRYHPSPPARSNAPTTPPLYLLTGSHYDTVRNGGKYDGRLGIFVPMACVQQLAQRQKRYPFGIEVVAFAEEEGQRYKAPFLASSALIGGFDPAWLDQSDADGITMRAAMQSAGWCSDDIGKIKRNPAHYLGFIEVHIEQGPVLNEVHLPLGVVTSINGSVRLLCSVVGMASHAGTTPMTRRRDAACAVAELALYLEKRAAADGDSVATIGQLTVPNGSVNVVPGRCDFSLDLRAPTNAQRDRLLADVMQELAAICSRRGVQPQTEVTMCADAAPSDSTLQSRWEKAVAQLGLPVLRLPSGAGHDAMKLHEIMPQAMLFVRGENAGISHNPLESTTCDDMQLAVEAYAHVLQQLEQDIA